MEHSRISPDTNREGGGFERARRVSYMQFYMVRKRGVRKNLESYGGHSVVEFLPRYLICPGSFRRATVGITSRDRRQSAFKRLLFPLLPLILIHFSTLHVFTVN